MEITKSQIAQAGLLLLLFMLKIILSRTGKKKQAYFRILVTQKEKDPWGAYLENLGNYNPRSKQLELKADRVKHWLDQGAQPSATVWNMLVTKGIVEGKKLKVTTISKKRAVKMEDKAKKAKADVAAKEPKPEEPKAE
jgi:small subunit ribosomal protein S16